MKNHFRECLLWKDRYCSFLIFVLKVWSGVTFSTEFFSENCPPHSLQKAVFFFSHQKKLAMIGHLYFLLTVGSSPHKKRAEKNRVPKTRNIWSQVSLDRGQWLAFWKLFVIQHSAFIWLNFLNHENRGQNLAIWRAFSLSILSHSVDTRPLDESVFQIMHYLS